MLAIILLIVLVLVIGVAFYMLTPREPQGLVQDALEASKSIVFWPTIAICASIFAGAMIVSIRRT